MIKRLIDKMFWRTALAATLVLCVYVYYFKSPSFREWMDGKLPQFKEFNAGLIARWGQSPAPVQAKNVEGQSAAGAGVPGGNLGATELRGHVRSQMEFGNETEKSQGLAGARPSGQGQTVDLAQLSRSRQEWPKSVTLKKAMEFPAVLDGKVIGSIKTPPGTQAHLLVIRDGRLGVEYQGGGAMVAVADTDLIERVLASRHVEGR